MTCEYLKSGYCHYWLDSVSRKDCRDCVVTRRKRQTNKETEIATTATKTPETGHKSEDKGER